MGKQLRPHLQLQAQLRAVSKRSKRTVH
jgi:hypothetical protein